MGIKLSRFFASPDLAGPLSTVQQCHPSSLSRARAQLSWRAFSDIFDSAVSAAYQLCPARDQHTWKGHSVFAVDGSRYTLPGSKDIRDTFDPGSGLHKQGEGHYPEAQVMVVYDVFRRLPVRCSMKSVHVSEREEALDFLPQLPEGILLYDRGYPSYEILYQHMTVHNREFVMRCPVKSSFAAVKKFAASGKAEDIISIKPPKTFRYKQPKEKRKDFVPLRLRAVRIAGPKGTISVMLTNLWDSQKYTPKDIAELYSRRWGVETHFRNDKVIQNVEKFHSLSANGILQEFYCSAIAAVIARALTWFAASQKYLKNNIEPQFKNAVLTVARSIKLLLPGNKQSQNRDFKELLQQTARIRYYPHRKPRPPQLRVSKQPHCKWNKKKELINSITSKP